MEILPWFSSLFSSFAALGKPCLQWQARCADGAVLFLTFFDVGVKLYEKEENENSL
jgi:hypothetical protein